MAKSPNPVRVVAWELVPVSVPVTVVKSQLPPEKRLTTTALVFTPASRSPATKMNVAL